VLIKILHQQRASFASDGNHLWKEVVGWFLVFVQLVLACAGCAVFSFADAQMRSKMPRAAISLLCAPSNLFPNGIGPADAQTADTVTQI
jgi:uncharacterized membrane protein YidH (DUF202 family)